MKWISFFQTPHDRIRFVTSELPEYNSMSYKKFLEYLYENFYIRDRSGILNEIDRFQTILLDTTTGEYIVLKPETDQKYSFDELYELNKEDDEKTNNQNKFIDRAKEILDTLWVKKRSQTMK